jgi:predicted MFS family arabinose efflux permease
MGRFFLRLYRDAYRGLPPAAWLVATATLVNRMGTMVLPFLTLYLIREIGFDTSEVGLLLGACGIFGVAGSYLGGKLCDHLSATWVQVFSLVSSGLLMLGMGFVHNRWLLAAGFALFSLLGEMFRPASAVALQSAVPQELRGQAAGLRRLAINLGVSAAPVVGGLLAMYDYLLLFLIDGATSIIAGIFLMVAFRKPVPRQPPAPGKTASAIFRLHGFLSPWQDKLFLAQQALLMLVGVLFLQTFSTLPLSLARDYGLNEAAIGLLLAINPVLIVLLEMVLLRLLGPLPILPVIAGGSFLIGAGLGMLGFGHSLMWAAFSITVFSFGEMLAFPLAEAWVANRASDSNIGTYLGIYSMAFSISRAVSPIIGLTVYDLYGAKLLWIFTGIGGVLVAATFLLLHRRESAPRVLPLGQPS